MKLLFDESKINFYASKYSRTYDNPIEEIKDEVMKRKCLKKCDLIKLSDWKTKGRAVHHVLQNSNDYVERITAASFTNTNEYQRVDSLFHLHGVQLATASAILHWFHKDPYPIWDFRARESVRLDTTQYRNWFERWEAYTLFCRDVAQRNNVTMRSLDRALWIYSKWYIQREGDIRATKGKFCRDTQARRTVKLPCLKLEDLVTQVTENNVHKEISTGPAVGNEVW